MEEVKQRRAKWNSDWEIFQDYIRIRRGQNTKILNNLVHYRPILREWCAKMKKEELFVKQRTEELLLEDFQIACDEAVFRE